MARQLTNNIRRVALGLGLTRGAHTVRVRLLRLSMLMLLVALIFAPSAGAATVTTTFTYTGGEQTFVVPAGVTSLQVVAVGGTGADGNNGLTGGLSPTLGVGGAGASGSVVTADLPVGDGAGEAAPGTKLYVEVGGNGVDGGFNGGGAGGAPFSGGVCVPGNGGDGGGASDVRTISSGDASDGGADSLESRLVVAGGGGGGGGSGCSSFVNLLGQTEPGNGGDGGNYNGASVPDGCLGDCGGPGVNGGDQASGGAGRGTGEFDGTTGAPVGVGGGAGNGCAWGGVGNGGADGAGGAGGSGANPAGDSYSYEVDPPYDYYPGSSGGGGGGGGGAGGGGGGAGGCWNNGSGGAGGGGGGGDFLLTNATAYCESAVCVTQAAPDAYDTSGVPSVAISYTSTTTPAPPTTTIALSPSVPSGLNGWYVSAVGVTVSATDVGGPGVASTSCVLDPLTAPLTFGAILAGCAYTASGATVTGDGQHVLYAASEDSDGDAETPVSASFMIDRTPPTVTCSTTPTYVFDGPGGSVSATVTDATSGPAVLSVSAAANVSAAGSKSVELTGYDNAGNSTAVSCPYMVSKAPQAVHFTSTPPASPTVGGIYTVTATGGASGNPVTLSIDSSSTAGACAISGATVTFTGAGSCVIDANQAGSTNYQTAAQLHQSLTVTVTAAGVGALTLSYVDGSAKYQASGALAKAVVNLATNLLSAVLGPVGPHLPATLDTALIDTYKLGTAALRVEGWLTAGQAATLNAAASEL